MLSRRKADINISDIYVGFGIDTHDAHVSMKLLILFCEIYEK